MIISSFTFVLIHSSGHLHSMHCSFKGVWWTQQISVLSMYGSSYSSVSKALQCFLKQASSALKSAELALLVQILSKSINLLFFTWNLQLLKYCCYCMRWLHPHLNLLLNWHMGKELSSVMVWLKKKAVDEKPLNFCKWSFSLSNSRFLLFFDTLLDSTKVCEGKQKYIYIDQKANYSNPECMGV